MPELGISVDLANEHSPKPKSIFKVPEVFIPHPPLHSTWSLHLLRSSVDHGNNDSAKAKDCPAALVYSLGSEKVPRLFSCLNKNLLQLLN